MKQYTMTIAGLERHLTMCPIGEDLYIAAFIMFGDTELTTRAAEELLSRAPAHDIIITAEAKGIPLAHEMARQDHDCKYIIARKGTKLYMTDPISVNVKSITTDRVQTLYLGSEDVDAIRGKRVLIVDDVVSTGESMLAIEELVKKAGGIIAGRLAVLAEGDAQQREDLIYLEKLPLLNGKGEPIG